MAEPRSIEDLAAAARQSFLERYNDSGRRLAKDLKKRKLTPSYRKHIDDWLGFLERARKAYETERVKEGGLDANVEAAAAALHHDLDAYVPYWIASMGGDFAVRAFCRMWAIDWFGIERGSYINDDDQHPEYPVARSNARCWASLRTGVESLDGVALRKTRDEAARIREKAPLALRCALDFAFPNEAAWAEEDIEAMLAAREPYFDYLFLHEGQFAAALLATRAPAEARAKMVRSWRSGERERWAGRCFACPSWPRCTARKRSPRSLGS